MYRKCLVQSVFSLYFCTQVFSRIINLKIYIKMKNTSVLRILILLPLFFCLEKLEAQVTIGANMAPQPFSVLELIAKYKSSPDAYGGLRLPQLSTAQRNTITGLSSADAYGLMIYNTDNNCTEYWNRIKWVSLCLGTANITLESNCPTDPPDPVPADGMVSPPCVFMPIDDPHCSEGYQVYLAVGSAYATLQITDEQTSAFSVTFSANNSSYPRIAIVRVTNKCTSEFKEFIFTQEGANCPTGTSSFTLSSTSTELCGENGAVIAWVNNPQAGVYYVWEFGGVVVHTGKYMQITRAGKYTVYAGLLGCETPTPQTITVTQSGGSSSNPPAIYATNGGIICSGGSVILTANNVVSGNTVKWFHNGALYNTGTNPLTIAANPAMAGEWFAIQQDGSCGSKGSNIITLIDQTTTSTSLPMPVATVNGTLLTNSPPPVICKNGTLELEITNASVYPAGTVYEWFNGSVSIYKGVDPVVYSVAPAIETMALSVQVSNSSGGCPNTVVSPPIAVTLTAPGATSISAGSAAVCGNTPAVLTALNASGLSYEWFKDGLKTAVTTGTTYSATTAGSYAVRYEDSNGCWSLMSLPANVVHSALISLNWQTQPPDTVIVGSAGTYTIQASPATNNYLWTSLYPLVATVTPIPPGNTASINYLTTGIATISVDATNACGTTNIEKIIVVKAGCAPVTNVALNHAGTITQKLDVNGNPKPGYEAIEFIATPSPTGSPDTYKWYVNDGLVQNNASNQFIYNTPNVAGTYLIHVIAENTCSNSQSATVTVIVTKDFAPDLSGNYRLSGKTCYDVWVTDWPLGNDCMPKSARIDNFADGYTFIYNFINTASFTQLTYDIDGPPGLISNHSQSGANGEILSITFNSDPTTGVKAMAESTSKITALKLIITAKYKNNTGQECQVSLEVLVQDCSCGCVLKKSATEYMTFMCYNLGAHTSVQGKSPADQQKHTPAADNYGYLYQWGRKTDGHQVRTSSTASGPISTLDSDGQIPSGNAAYGKFIYNNTASPFDWRSPQKNNLWNIGSESSPQKHVGNDPCPPGWRVPTKAEFTAVVDAGLNTRSAWFSSPTPGYLLRPAGTSENTIFLPAGGNRGYSSGGVGSVGTQGYYWNSTPSSVNTSSASDLYLDSTRIGVGSAYRTYGHSIRCVAE
jgi:uncharacterized protein (TIGR02145 family)